MAMRQSDWGVEYDKTTQSLVVTFPNGVPYTYEGVPPDIAQKFLESDDRARFFNRYIRGMY